ncbi:MAG: hypothetical protein RL108_1823 [Bacteroidota bacterium]|jgi:hypothetical protein
MKNYYKVLFFILVLINFENICFGQKTLNKKKTEGITIGEYLESLEKDNSNASKYDTETWILEKLNTITPKNYTLNTPKLGSEYSLIPEYIETNYFNYNYYFDSYSLNITYQEQSSNGKVSVMKISIPIFDIDYIDIQGQFLSISTHKDSIKKFDISRNEKTVTSYFQTAYKSNQETDILVRLKQAFLHLKKFYKKPVTNEPF